MLNDFVNFFDVFVTFALLIIIGIQLSSRKRVRIANDAHLEMIYTLRGIRAQMLGIEMTTQSIKLEHQQLRDSITMMNERLQCMQRQIDNRQ